MSVSNPTTCSVAVKRCMCPRCHRASTKSQGPPDDSPWLLGWVRLFSALSCAEGGCSSWVCNCISGQQVPVRCHRDQAENAGEKRTGLDSMWGLLEHWHQCSGEPGSWGSSSRPECPKPVAVCMSLPTQWVESLEWELHYIPSYLENLEKNLASWQNPN